MKYTINYSKAHFNQLLMTSNKDEISKAAWKKKKGHKTHEGTIRMKEHLSETIQTRKQWSNIFTKLKGRNKSDKQKCQPRFVYQDFYIHSNDKITNHLVIWKKWREVYQVEGNGHR